MRSPRLLAAALLGAALVSACGSTAQPLAGGAPVADGLAPPTTGSGLPDPVAGGEVVDPGVPTGPGTSAGSSGSAGSPGTATGGPAAPGPGRVVASTGAASAIPRTGKGWDATQVFVGVTTQKDVNAAAGNLGINSLDAGDQEGQARAVLAELNKRGGIFGRKLVPVFRDHSTAALQSNDSAEGQATCTFFTQDRPVAVVINPVSLIDNEAFRSCMARAKVPTFALSVQPIDSQVARALAPYYYSSVTPPYDRLAPVLVSRLKANGYFSGWNTATGAAAPGGAVVGLVVEDTPTGARVEKILTRELAAAGHAPVEVFRYVESGEFANAVLQFRSSGVTHVVATDAKMLAFLIAADGQGYRPRYGISSYWAPNAFLEETAPDGQLIGSMGVGFAPSLDVNQARDAEDMPGEAECRAMLKAGGQTFDGKRFAEAVGYAFCDGFRLFVAAAARGGGLLGADVARGLQQVGQAFSPAFAFRSGLGGGAFYVPGGGRDLRYDAGCACYRYKDKRTFPI